jgi:hypothetical protein
MTNKFALGQMKRIEPRTVWPHEEQDFTPWLYANLDKLGEALGLELEGQERECDVGDFAVDIVARELGRLNREGGEGRPEFFGVELQVVQIDDSKPAVNLRPVAFPNDWTRDLNERDTGTVSEKRQKYQAFFQGLLDDLRDQKFSNAKKAQPQNWYSFASGTRGYVYSVSFANGGRLRVDLYLDLQDTNENKAAFEKLHAEKDSIEADFGEPLTWERLDNRRACRISVYTEGSIDDAQDALAAHRRWMAEKLLKMKKVLGPRIM